MKRIRQVQRPAIGSDRSSVQLLAGFTLLCTVLRGPSALGSTGRWGLLILAAVAMTALILELVQHRLLIILISLTVLLFALAVPRRALTRPRCRTVEGLS
jgi:hypothetical protein